MAVFRLEHLDGAVEAVVFPDAYEQFGVHLKNDAAILLCGEIAHEEKALKIKVAELYPLAEAARHFAQSVSVHVPAAHLEDGRLEKVHAILARHPGDTPVTICLQFPGGEKVFVNAHRDLKVTPTEGLVFALEHALGEDSVYVAVNRNPCKRPPAERRAWNGGG
jgi:DNA polymerase-3 subunit alpha